MKAILYCRKSSESEDRQVKSLDAQDYELRKVAERDDIEIVCQYRESMSAKTFGRPLFNEMIQKISAGEGDTILCWKTDRLSRNPTDSAILQNLFQQGLLKSIITIDRTYRSSDNVLIFGIEQLMAQQYIRDLSENVKRGNREKLRRGEWPNHAPYGYRNDKNTKTLKVVPAQVVKVKKVYEMYASGKYTFAQIGKILNFAKSHVGHILEKTFYYGLMERDGVFYPGKHQPIITKELYEQAQKVKKGVTVTPLRAHTLFFPFRGLLKCAECSCQLTATRKKDKYDYYYCTNGKRICTQHTNYLDSKDTDQFFVEALQKIQFDEELIEIMYQGAREVLLNGHSDTQKTLDGISLELSQIKQQERKLLQSYTTGLIDESLYTEEAKRLGVCKTDLEQKYKNYSVNATITQDTLELVKNVFLESSRALSEYQNSNPEQKREKLENLLWNLEVKDKKVANHSFKSPYNYLATAPKKGDLRTMLPVRDSNPSR